MRAGILAMPASFLPERRVHLKLGKHRLDLGSPRVMGVLNRTPDSFSDGGRYTAFDAALRHAETLVREGADILDVGGESTRPGAEAVSVQQELDRVVPLIERMAGFGVPLSVDTSKPEVMREAVHAGAAMINDVYALRRPGALAAAAVIAVLNGAHIVRVHDVAITIDALKVAAAARR